MTIQAETLKLNNVNRKRIEWIDICKGLGIIAVILGHKGIMFPYIYSFHMPLFFFLSGYLFTYEKYPNLLKFIKTKAKSLLLPYLIFSIISMIIVYLTSNIGVNTSQIDLNFWINQLILSKRNFIPFNVALWFLTSIFTVEILFFILIKYVRKEFFIWIILFISAYIGCVVLLVPGSVNTLVWSFDASIYYMLFFAIGYFLKVKRIVVSKKYRSFLFIILAFISVSMCFDQNTVNFLFKNRLNIPIGIYSLFREVFLSIAGIYTFVYISKLIGKSKKLSFIGENSLTFFALHLPIGFVVVDKIVYLLNIGQLPELLTGFLYTVGSIISIMPFIYLQKNHREIVNVFRVKFKNIA